MSKRELLIVLFALLAISFSVFQCNESSKQSLSNAKLKLENKALKKQVLEDSSALYSQDIELMNSEQREVLLSAMSDSLRLKNAELIATIRSRTVRKTEVDLGPVTKIPEGKAPCDTFGKVAAGHYLKLPVSKELVDRFRYSAISIDTNGVFSDSTVTYAVLDYGIGDTLKAGFFNRLFGRKNKVVRLRVDNPDMIIEKMNTIVIEDEKKFHQTGVFKFLFGLGVGVVLVGVLF